MKFEIWGLSGSLATEHEHQMDERHASDSGTGWTRFDAACNRFRVDSELSRLNESHGATTAISPTLELALEAALRAADVDRRAGRSHRPSGAARPRLRPGLRRTRRRRPDPRTRGAARHGDFGDSPRPR